MAYQLDTDNVKDTAAQIAEMLNSKQLTVIIDGQSHNDCLSKGMYDSEVEYYKTSRGKGRHKSTVVTLVLHTQTDTYTFSAGRGAVNVEIDRGSVIITQHDILGNPRRHEFKLVRTG